MKKQTGSIVGILIAYFSIAFSLNSIVRGEPLSVSNDHYQLTLSDKTGEILSFISHGRQTIKPGRPRPLFTLRFRNAQGKAIDLNALEAKKFGQKQKVSDKATVITMHYQGLKGYPINAVVRVRCPANSPMTYWGISVENKSSLVLDHIDFPTVVVPNDLRAKAGDGQVFWPAMEGVVIDDLDIREKSHARFRPIEHPHHGWRGLYPSSCPMQFMAYYGKGGGLYLAAHDQEAYPKGIEYHGYRDGGIQLDFRVFPGAVTKKRFSLPYEMVLGAFKGNWYDAADIYRKWLENSKMPRPKKLSANPAIPDWFESSPVIVTYPIRGTGRDRGGMSTNEYYPYTKALPTLEHYSKAFDSKIMALLMHWEGSAPWAPPYVWPPHGGEKNYLEFVKALHAKGNLAGLYASGIGYTIKSNIDPSYNMEKEFEQKNIKSVVTIAPDGSVAQNGVCAGPRAQRIGHDMCPANAFVKNVVAREVGSIIKSGTDYIQYFDQNLGGSCYRCYSKDHGHPPGPGPWQNEEMIKIYKTLNDLIKRSGRKVLIGCEAAAGEPYIPYLLFNDLRSTINLRFGSPVPAYAYVNHEYVNNFMGNQNAIQHFVDHKKSPLNLLQRYAYAFIGGDMFTIILKDKGQMHWEWGMSWDKPAPDQVSTQGLIANLNPWRKGVGKPYLVYGRMQKPYTVTGDYELPMITTKGAKLYFRSIFTSKWTNAGKSAQILVNYTSKPQTVTVNCKKMVHSKAVVYTKPAGKGSPTKITDKSELNLTIDPLSAVMVEFGP
jgi:hypothetical protein